jgi:site-specific DNA-methyltransferase (adenine-specific)
MGKEWDGGDIAFRKETWELCHELLLPGGHLLAFAATKNYHRMAVAIEDAGFEIRDQIGWVYATGFPKSHDISKDIDKMSGIGRENKFEGLGRGYSGPSGNKRCEICNKWLVSGNPCRCPRPQDKSQSEYAKKWEGWGTALKPAWEPICVARKALEENTIAKNVLKYGTGGLNIDDCRISTDEMITNHSRGVESSKSKGIYGDSKQQETHQTEGQSLGRWPANVIHDGSDEVIDAFPISNSTRINNPNNNIGKGNHDATSFSLAAEREYIDYRDSGSAARFFYSAKASKEERNGSKHPTVKPVALMRYLVRLVTPKDGIVLDPFCGTGTTLEAAYLEDIQSIGIERDPEYAQDIRKRMSKFAGALF